jgi:hypothetical protein
MQKSEIVDAVAELVSDNSGAMRQLVNRWVNIVLDDIASRGLLNSLKREESASLVSGQRNYDLAADTDHVYKVFVPAWGDPQGKLNKKTDDEFLNLMFEDGFELTGRPYAYNIFGPNALRLHPIPNLENAPVTPTTLQKIYVWKYKDIEHLDETDEIVEIKGKHTPLLIYGAYAMGAKFDSILDASDARGMFERGIKRLFFDETLDLERAKQVRYRDLG